MVSQCRPIGIVVLLGLGFLLFVASAGAQDFQQAQGDVDARLEGALQELSAGRGEIAKEKLPLSRSVSKLEREVLGLRRERARLYELHDSRNLDLTSLRAQVEALETQDDFVRSRLSEFVRNFEARLDLSELPEFEERTTAARLAERNVDLDASGKRDAQLRVVEAAIGRMQGQLGGRRYAGQALSPDGVVEDGTFVSFGPTTYFASEDGSVAGLVETQLNAALPVVVPLPGDYGSRVAQLSQTGTAELPFDATLGKALKKAQASKTLAQYAEQGGPVGAVIIALGLTALLLTAFKAYEILSFQVAPPGEVDVVLGELAKGNVEAAAWQAGRLDGVSAEMLTTGVDHAHESRAVLEELLFETILRVRPGLERFLPFLAITAAAAPLLGLLGTVIGMIETFQLITIFGTGDAKSLSSGISEALVTTALGLIVAIPTLILHGALSRMAKRKLGLLEEMSVAFVNGVSTLAANESGSKLGNAQR